jgi:hypothetical protein
MDRRKFAASPSGDLQMSAYARFARVMEMFGEPHYQQAYQRGLAWAEEVFRSWVESGRPVPRELPRSKHDAVFVLARGQLVDVERQSRAAAVLYATARVRWRRLVSLDVTRRAS